MANRRAHSGAPDTYHTTRRYILKKVARDDAWFADPADSDDEFPGDDLEAPCPSIEDRIWRHPSEVGWHQMAGHRSAWASLWTTRNGWWKPRDRDTMPPWSRSGTRVRQPAAWSALTRGARDPSHGASDISSSQGTHIHWPPVLAAGAVAVVIGSFVVLVGLHLTSERNYQVRRSFGVKGVGASLPLISKGVPTGRTSTGVPIASISSVEAGPSVIKTISELCAASVRITSVRHGVAATGAGLVIRPNGMIITTSRLVDGAKSITISTPAGVLSRATLVGSDASSDVAVIKATRTTIKFHTLPDLTNARAQAHVGELTIAVAPGSHRKENVAFGVVKSIGHHARIASGPPLLDSIRTDAPLKNGAQGGALINGAGQLIGMIASSGKTKSGLQTTSIPARLALGVANELASSGHVVHGWLGIEATDVNPGTTVASGSTAGAKVTAVEPASSAQRAGIRPGDIISTLDGQTIVSMAELRSDLYLLPPYTRVVLGILRAGESGPLLVSTVLAPNPA